MAVKEVAFTGMPQEEETTRKTARPPGKRDSKEEVKLLAEALDRPEVNGNIADAARLLGMDYQKAYRIVQKNPFLRANHPAQSPEDRIMSDDDEVHRDDGLIGEAERRAVVALAEESKTMAKSEWRRDLPESHRDQLKDMELWSRMPLAEMSRLTHGGLGKTLIGLLSMYDKYVELATNGGPELVFIEKSQSYKDLQVDYSKMAVKLAAEIRQVRGQVEDSIRLMLLVQKTEDERKQKQGRGGRPVLDAPALEVPRHTT